MRKTRTGTTTGDSQYWLVVPGANNVVAGGDTGMSLAMVAEWLSESA